MQEIASLEHYLFVFKPREVHTGPFDTEVINIRAIKTILFRYHDFDYLRISHYAKHVDATADI